MTEQDFLDKYQNIFTSKFHPLLFKDFIKNGYWGYYSAYIHVWYKKDKNPFHRQDEIVVDISTDDQAGRSVGFEYNDKVDTRESAYYDCLEYVIKYYGKDKQKTKNLEAKMTIESL